MKPSKHEAPTVVFWDMCSCPVPPGVDPRRVGPCIERFLKYLGFRGRLIITAVGILTAVPESVLQKVSSTGIFLHHANDSYMSMEGLLYCLSCDINPPANVMVISTPPSYSHMLTLLHEEDGFNVIYPFSYEVPQEPSSINSLWRNFLMEDSWPPPEKVKCSKTDEWWHNVTYSVRPRSPSSIGSRWSCLLRADSWPQLKEDKCSTTGEWVCMVCDDQGGLGARRLIRHLSSREHAHELLEILSPCRCKDLWCKHGLDPMAETPLYYYPDTVVWTGDVSLMKKKEPENESLRRSEIETMQSEKDKAREEALAKPGRPRETSSRRRSPVPRRGASPRRLPDSPPRRRPGSSIRRRGETPPRRRLASPSRGRSPSSPPPRGSPRRIRGSPVRRRSPPPLRRSPIRRRSRSPIRRPGRSRSRSISPRRARGPAGRRGRSSSYSSSPSPRRNESLRRSEIETMQSEKDKAMEEALAKLESLRREMETMQSKNKAIAENSKEQEAELRRLKVQCDQWRKAAEVASDMLAGGSNNNNSKYIERTGSREPLLKRRNVKVAPYMYETDDELSLPKKKKGDDELSLPKKKKGSMLKKICVGY